MTEKQDGYARQIIAEGVRRNISPRGIIIALATALVESSLQNYANSKVPESMAIEHDAVGQDGLSVGVFQQQVRDTGNGWWWGDAATCMNVTLSAGLFYDRLAKLDYNSPTHTPGFYAQAVQSSAFPDRYDQRFGDAAALFNRLTAVASPPAGPSRFRLNVNYALHEFFKRLGNPYVYGGMWSKTNVRQGTDCSGIWNDVLGMCRDGEGFIWGRESEGATTESYRYIPVGDRGPFGTVRVARPQDVPADAAARVALHHGPGGGANSHMWGELDGVRIESAGSKGAVTGNDAKAFTDGYANAWCFLPGPIDTGTIPIPPPTGGFLMGLSDQEQRNLYNAIMTQRPSRSALRGLGQGTVGDAADQVWDIDGSVHVLYCYLRARLGDPVELGLLQEVAAADLGKFPDRANDAALAQAMLAELSTAPAVEPPLLPPAPPPPHPDTSRELAAAYAEIARLRDENSRLTAPSTALVETNGNGSVVDTVSTGQLIGNAYDALEALRLADALPIENRAPLAALIAVLQTKNGSTL